MTLAIVHLAYSASAQEAAEPVYYSRSTSNGVKGDDEPGNGHAGGSGGVDTTPNSFVIPDEQITSNSVDISAAEVNVNAGNGGDGGIGGPSDTFGEGGAGGGGDIAMLFNEKNTISTVGDYTYGIACLSIGGIGVNVAATGSITGGARATIADAEDGAAVYIVGGTQSVLANEGAIRAGQSGIAINASRTQLAIDNASVIVGNVLKSGAGSSISMKNRKGAALHAGDRLDLDRLVNAGRVAPDGDDQFVQTALPGRYVQKASGVLAVDVGRSNGSPGLRSDHLIVGASAVVDGTLEATYRIGEAGALPDTGPQRVAVLSARGGLTLAEGFSVRPSAVARYQLAQRSDRVFLHYDVDFANDGIRARANDNQFALGQHLQNTFATGKITGTAASGAEALIAIENPDDYRSALDSLGTEIFGNTQISTLHSAQGFTNALMSCTDRRARTNDIRVLPEQSRIT